MPNQITNPDKISYGLLDFSKDMHLLYASPTPNSYRGARIAAAKKRIKSHVLVYYCYQIAIELDLDVTPTLINALIKGWTGRGISQRILRECFATPGRKADQISVHFQRNTTLLHLAQGLEHGVSLLDCLIDYYRPFILKELKITNEDMATILITEQTQYLYRS